jgi:hypothetical protein
MQKIVSKIFQLIIEKIEKREGKNILVLHMGHADSQMLGLRTRWRARSRSLQLDYIFICNFPGS